MLICATCCTCVFMVEWDKGRWCVCASAVKRCGCPQTSSCIWFRFIQKRTKKQDDMTSISWLIQTFTSNTTDESSLWCLSVTLFGVLHVLFIFQMTILIATALQPQRSRSYALALLSHRHVSVDVTCSHVFIHIKCKIMFVCCCGGTWLNQVVYCCFMGLFTCVEESINWTDRPEWD